MRWLEKKTIYKKKFSWFKFCIYCGENAECLDHVWPLSHTEGLQTWRPSVRKELFQGLNLVPSCNECNRLAGAKPFTSIKNKRDFIKSRLLEKYRKKSRQIIWDEEDLEGIGKNLRSFIIRGQQKKLRIDRRLLWPKFVHP